MGPQKFDLASERKHFLFLSETDDSYFLSETAGFLFVWTGLKWVGIQMGCLLMPNIYD